MSRPRNVPRTKNTARKSTTVVPIVPQETRRNSQQMFARAINRLTDQVRNETIRYSGPVGLGIGKGGLRRMRRTVPKRKEIERSAKSTTKRSIPLGNFARLVRWLMRDSFRSDLKLQVAALMVMHEAVEAYAIQMFETSNLFVMHARRVTVMPKDLNLYQRVQARPDFYQRVGQRSNTLPS